jgi:Skp family chaperone for outer membrane proteins
LVKDDHPPARSADVRKLLLSATIVGLVCSQASRTPAQQFSQGGNAGKFGLAVVDISFIFKNYPQFTTAIEALKGEMEKADGALKADRDRLARMEEERNTQKPGTAEFKRLDEELARQKAEFSIKQGTVRRDFLEREAKIYYTTYGQVADAVKRYASGNNIGMVLRFNGDAIDSNQREDVMRAIMQPIVYQSNIDITPEVLLVLGVDVRRLSTAPTGGAAPAGPAGGVTGPQANRGTLQR